MAGSEAADQGLEGVGSIRAGSGREGPLLPNAAAAGEQIVTWVCSYVGGGSRSRGEYWAGRQLGREVGFPVPVSWRAAGTQVDKDGRDREQLTLALAFSRHPPEGGLVKQPAGSA